MRRHSGFDWLELILGVILIGLGILAFVQPDLTLTGLVMAYGITAVVMGIADVILFIRMERYTGFGPILSLITGILSVMSGIMLTAYPRAGVLVLSMLFPIWFMAHCISRLLQLNSIRFFVGSGVYTVTLVLNVLGLILGFLMLFRPIFTLTVLQTFAGAYLILLGVDAIVMAVSRMGSRW